MKRQLGNGDSEADPENGPSESKKPRIQLLLQAPIRGRRRRIKLVRLKSLGIPARNSSEQI